MKKYKIFQVLGNGTIAAVTDPHVAYYYDTEPEAEKVITELQLVGIGTYTILTVYV